jgi:RND family efflux transporter MFP subunit
MNAERHDLLNKLCIERDSETPGDQFEPFGRGSWVWLVGLVTVVLVLSLGIVIGRGGGDKFEGGADSQTTDKTNVITTADFSSDAAVTGNPMPSVVEARHVLDASGYVVAQRMATVSSKTTGKIIEIMVKEGMAVEADQLLARMDSTSEQIEFDLFHSQVEAARAGLREAQARLREVELSLMRTENLVKNNLVSIAELDSSRAAVDSLLAAVDMRKAELNVAEQRLALARQHLDDTFIRAPFAGVVTVKNAQPGEIVSPVSAGGGFTRTGVCTLVDMGSLEVEVDINEAYITRVFIGQRVDARLDAYPDWTVPARVSTIVPTADRQKASINVHVQFDELDPRILPEMGVKVRFLGEKSEKGD